ncbi:MAG: thiolase family protein [Bdellovibrionota bacterium]
MTVPVVTSRLNRPVFIKSALRTPIGKFGGALLPVAAAELAALCLKAAIAASKTNDTPDLVILGHARQAGCGPNPARQAAIGAGLPNSIPALTLNQACASGLAAIIMGVEKIGLGRAKTVWAGGVESMSNTPYLIPQARWGMRMGNGQIVDGMHRDGFFCPMADMLMGATVDTELVPMFKISREEQDAYALESQVRAGRAAEKGLFKEETFEIQSSKMKTPLAIDEHARPQTTLESLAKLAPVFDAKSGSVTAGNSSGITDGAAFVKLSDNSQDALAEILDYEQCALDPKLMGIGPVECTETLLKRNGITVGDLEVVELNEAFAAQVIACQRQLKIPSEKLNPNGGSIALGHPIGATGARIVVTLVHELRRRGSGKLGLATLCVSGGQGVAVLVRSL